MWVGRYFMKSILLYIISFLIICLRLNSQTLNFSNTETFKPPIIIDILPQTKELKRCSTISISYPKVIAVKPFDDTCSLLNYYYTPYDTTFLRSLEDRGDGLQFIVDTSQKVTIKFDKLREYYVGNDTTQIYYQGYPCFVYNETSSVKWLETQDDRIIVIQEARDSNYHWRPIQIWEWSWCGNSFIKAPIKPHHYLLFKTPIFKGNFYTDTRLKLYSRDAVYYSNTYRSWINYNQFNLPKKLTGKNGNPIRNFGFLNL